MPEPKYRKPRAATFEGNVYVVRDVLHASGEFSGVCQYAVTDEDGDVRWKNCEEGVLFASIEPFAEAC